MTRTLREVSELIQITITPSMLDEVSSEAPNGRVHAGVVETVQAVDGEKIAVYPQAGADWYITNAAFVAKARELFALAAQLRADTLGRPVKASADARAALVQPE